MKRESAVAQGVTEAWDFYLSQHDVSVPAIIGDAIEKSFLAWLNANEDELLAKVAKLITDELQSRGKTS